MRRWVYAGLAATVAGLGVLTGLGIAYRQRWSWLVIPTWITALATLGLFAGAVVTAFYAVKTFTGQAEQLREQHNFNRQQTGFNEAQLKILHNQELLARQVERRQRTPQFRADLLTRNDGDVSMYVHLRLLSEEPLDRIDVKLLDQADGFPVECPVGFTPGQWGVPRYAADGSSAWDGPRRYQEAGLRDRAWWPADPGVDANVGPETCTRLDVGGAAVWRIKRFPDMDWPPFAHLRVACIANGEKWTVTLDIDLPQGT
jgi:hypothetical protein